MNKLYVLVGVPASAKSGMLLDLLSVRLYNNISNNNADSRVPLINTNIGTK